MRRLLTIVALLVGMTAAAQIEIMKKRTERADPMLSEHGSVIWESLHMYIEERDNGEIYLAIQNPSHIFLDDSNTKVGLYDARGKLVSMSSEWRTSSNEESTFMSLRYGGVKEEGDTIYARDLDKSGIVYLGYDPYSLLRLKGYHIITEPVHVLRFLRQNKGSYIRVTTRLYGGYIFDVKARPIDL